MIGGEVVVSGRIAELLKRDARRSEITLSGPFHELRGAWSANGVKTREVGGQLVVEVEGAAATTRILQGALEAGLTIEQVVPRQETLEDLFVREAIASGEAAASA